MKRYHDLFSVNRPQLLYGAATSLRLGDFECLHLELYVTILVRPCHTLHLRKKTTEFDNVGIR